MSAYAHFVSNRISQLLVAWSKPIEAGESLVETYFQCFPDRPKLVRRPDVAFLTAATIAGYGWDDPHVRLVPDLAVEVISPGDDWYDVAEKLGEYHGVGVPLVWLADPALHRVMVEPNPATGQKPTVLTVDEQLAGGDVLPGFVCRVGDFFPVVPSKTKS